MRLTLRPAEVSDAKIYYKWITDRDVIKYITTFKIKTVNHEKQFIKNTLKKDDELLFSIKNENGLLIGNAGLRLSKNNKKAVLGIMIGEKTQWDKGYGTEAVKMLADFVFNRLKYNRFELDVFTENRRAIKVYKRIGFKKEGIKRESAKSPVMKKYSDLFIMSILKKEWKNK